MHNEVYLLLKTVAVFVFLELDVGARGLTAVGVQVPRELYKRIVEVCICRKKIKKIKNEIVVITVVIDTQ